jgi:geranylgeranylglycerol-phosphate geranylgeranyltransferase
MAGLAVAIAFVVAGGSLDLYLPLSAAFISAFIITAAGNSINDYYDSEIDKKNAPQRPIPSGGISKKGALSFALLLFFLGVIVAAFVNIWTIALASFNSVALIFYARNLKGMVFWGNLDVSYLTGSTFIYGGLAAGAPLVTVFLFLLAFLINMGREIIGDVEDIVGDKKEGIKTLAIKVGAKKSWLVASVFILTAVAMSPLPYSLGLMSVYYLIVVLAADTIFVYSIVQRNPRKNQKLTKMGIFIALAAFIIGAFV